MHQYRKIRWCGLDREKTRTSSETPLNLTVAPASPLRYPADRRPVARPGRIRARRRASECEKSRTDSEKAISTVTYRGRGLAPAAPLGLRERHKKSYLDGKHGMAPRENPKSYLCRNRDYDVNQKLAPMQKKSRTSAENLPASTPEVAPLPKTDLDRRPEGREKSHQYGKAGGKPPKSRTSGEITRTNKEKTRTNTEKRCHIRPVAYSGQHG